ncbi:NAD-dependent epimerase/dehydratase family protein [Piscinibacter koreensis]|uniref:NAD(P)-dependent oxidoreductase n=1 Tax=Piscinibacter koreensis TaxID=2742824 RepID=A0A7Y6NRX3_9BURK|nr:NAD-dependent epimerase/dehydratase family protein [Schlegelella koreensis]NUZ08201.1 NAD(P)-dependent oxidoreductase [Schlegelella koreensis]
MKVFVTGGTGFIGGNVLHALVREGHEVVALRRPGGTPVPAGTPAVQWVEKPMDALAAADITGCDALVHLAAVGISPRLATWQECFHWNVDVMIGLVQQAHAAGVRRVVAAGTFAEYGRSADRYEFIPPDAPLLPTAAYPASKAAGFAALSGLAAELGIEVCYLRVFSAFGEGQHQANFWPALRAAALAGEDFPMTAGEQVRDFVPVEDVAAAFAKAVVRGDVRAGMPLALNVASGRPMSVRAFAEHWWAEWRATGQLLVGSRPLRSGEQMRVAGELEKVQR